MTVSPHACSSAYAMRSDLLVGKSIPCRALATSVGLLCRVRLLDALWRDEPVRWSTDFGEAELSHLNLYDRTVEGLVLKDVPGCTVQYHPEAGPGPHDARYLFDRFLAEIVDD